MNEENKSVMIAKTIIFAFEQKANPDKEWVIDQMIRRLTGDKYETVMKVFCGEDNK
jgi:hypothetical protein